MEKINESKKLTRECITTALLLLIEEKPYEKISISEITEKAGVSRMAYYRNYSDKDDILLSYIIETENSFLNSIVDQSLTFRQMIIEAGRFFHRSSDVLNIADKLPVSKRIFSELSANLFSFFPQINYSSRLGYMASFYAGAIISVFRTWLENGACESVEEIADIICDNVSVELITYYDKAISTGDFSH